jgi:hypothetical protein
VEGKDKKNKGERQMGHTPMIKLLYEPIHAISI